MSVKQASPSAAAFYSAAIQTLRIQVAALSSAAFLWLASVVALEPWLGGVGARTPILPLSIMVSKPNNSCGRTEQRPFKQTTQV